MLNYSRIGRGIKIERKASNINDNVDGVLTPIGSALQSHESIRMAETYPSTADYYKAKKNIRGTAYDR